MFPPRVEEMLKTLQAGDGSAPNADPQPAISPLVHYSAIPGAVPQAAEVHNEAQTIRTDNENQDSKAAAYTALSISNNACKDRPTTAASMQVSNAHGYCSRITNKGGQRHVQIDRGRLS